MTVIVGAGAAGLSLGVMLDGKVTIYERADEPGGLCRSHCIDGFTFDTGPHILGGIPESVAWIVESTGVEFVEGHTRNVGFVGGDYCAHPFTNPDDGHAYMAKMWKADPASLSAAGLGAQPGRKPGGVSSFLYPARGGYQAITDAWARRLDGAITYGVKVSRQMADVVWTGPVPSARYNTLVTVTVGFEITNLEPPDWTAIYLPGPETPFHRLSFPSAFSPHNAPPGCYSIQLEASVDPARPYPILREEVPDVLERLGLWARPVFDYMEITTHAYPVPDGTLADGHGRTGGHKYLNLDGVVAASRALVGALT